MISWLARFVMHPWLLAGGALLVSVPIIIHLLNKRKFKVIDWAAMDFLFEADKKNRRRVRLEDLLILLLRVLAVLLLVAMLARPYRTGALASLLGGKTGYERIVLLDDSPSMDARQQSHSAIQQARRVLTELVRQFGTHHGSDTLTVFVTSRPRVPLVKEAVLTPETVNRLSAEFGAWSVSSRPAHFVDAIGELEKHIAGQASHLNRLVYVVTDLRRSDWDPPGKQSDAAGPLPALRRLAENTTGCYIVDVGGPQTDNLAITSLLPVDNVVAVGQTCRFEVKVQNYGPSDAENVEVRLAPEGSLPVTGRIERVPAGKSAALPLTLTFPLQDPDRDPEPVALRAELQISPGAGEDRLSADNVRFYPARVAQGIRTLVVNGDPSVDPEKAETHFLSLALSPPGDSRSLILPRIVSPSEFEATDLDAYQVVYLANVDQLSDARRTTLEQWVRRGGGLVIALGDQLTDLGWFNAQMYRGGAGLSPVEVQGIVGSEDRRQWALLEVAYKKRHDLMNLYEGDSSVFLEGIKVFRWWQCHVPETQLAAGKVNVLARLTDADHSPLLVERALEKGQGRVVLLTTSLDADWNAWPQEHASYVLFFQLLTRYVAQTTPQAGLIEIGQPIRVPLDAARHKREATLVRPDGEKTGLSAEQDQAAANAASGAKPEPAPQAAPPATAEAAWRLTTTETDAPGPYRIELTLRDGARESVLFAANLSGDDGNLEPLASASVKQQLQDSRVELLTADSLLAVSGSQSKSEWWLMVLGVVGIVLGAEQALAWLFGRRR